MLDGGWWAPIICGANSELHCNCCAPHIVFQVKTQYMKGFKVIQCIKIDSFYICGKTEPDHEKIVYRGLRPSCTQTQACSVT